jgi:hypothetical protein
MKAFRIFLLVLAILLAAFLLDRRANLTRAQTEQTSTTASQPQPPPPQPDPPGTIDGAKNPELIPDEVAFRLVFLGLAEREEATEAENARFRAKIASAGLDEEDTEALFRVLANFHKQLDELNAKAQEIRSRNPIIQAGTPDYEQLVELSKQRDPVYAEAMSAVPARLSLMGMDKFHAYVQKEKRRMKHRPESAPQR